MNPRSRFRRNSPPERRAQCNRHNNRNEHTADAIAQALNVGAAGLRPLDGSNNV